VGHRRWKGYVAVFRTLPMREILTYGDTLSAQAKALGH
jgi:hypothetical protein